MVKPDPKSVFSLLTFSHCLLPAFTRHLCLLSGGQRETPGPQSRGRPWPTPPAFLALSTEEDQAALWPRAEALG